MSTPAEKAKKTRAKNVRKKKAAEEELAETKRKLSIANAKLAYRNKLMKEGWGPRNNKK